MLLLLALVLPVVSSYLLPMYRPMPGAPIPQGPMQLPMQPMQTLPLPVPYNQIGPAGPAGPAGPGAPQRGCPMSPYATFLTKEQQETLHELITEARATGADEPAVKTHIDKYLQEILTPQKMIEFQTANSQFEAQRRGKRSTDETSKQLPQKLFDLVDKYTDGITDDYAKFYEETVVNRHRE